VAPEHEGSSPHTQQPATGPNPKPTESTPHPPVSLSKIHSDLILPSTPRSSKSSLSFWLSHQNPVHFSLLSQTCHMPRPLHSPWFDLPNDIWGCVKIMTPLTVQLPPCSCYVGPNFFLRTLFSNTLSLCSSIRLSHEAQNSLTNDDQPTEIVYYRIYVYTCLSVSTC
jgi:hypothetical protein